MQTNRRIIITGPTGAVGMALIKRCIKDETDAVVVCHRGSDRGTQIPDDPHIHMGEADFADLKGIGKKELGIEQGERADVFYHLAWEGTTGESRNDMALQIQNIQYTIDAVELDFWSCSLQ